MSYLEAAAAAAAAAEEEEEEGLDMGREEAGETRLKFT
jgi:hypothetical protein